MQIAAGLDTLQCTQVELRRSRKHSYPEVAQKNWRRKQFYFPIERKNPITNSKSKLNVSLGQSSLTLKIWKDAVKRCKKLPKITLTKNWLEKGLFFRKAAVYVLKQQLLFPNGNFCRKHDKLSKLHTNSFFPISKSLAANVAHLPKCFPEFTKIQGNELP